MLQKIQNFLKELREKDEPVKKRWLIIFSAGAMVIVIGLWSLYFNVTIQNFNEPKQQVQKTGFWEIFKNGLSIASKEAGLKLSELTASLRNITAKTNSITIQIADMSFVVKKGLTPIKPKKLP
jgi:hypothetical protein